jgi:hypothetical protein
MTENECSICVENFNKSKHLKCNCPHCDYAFCRKCVQTYILTIELNGITCMNCKKGWTTDTIDGYVTKTFRNKDLKEHRERVLIERERSLLPATQPEVQYVIQMRKFNNQLKDYYVERNKLDEKINKLTEEMTIFSNRPKNNKTHVHFTIHCPVENCKGFIESSKWECGICSIKVCKECHECKKDENHECNEASLETAKLIRKDSKPCPGCSTLIFKISGCNQMWCTQCHTTFLWTTGEIMKGAIHNPHYYEWMRNNNHVPPRNVGDVPCGGLIRLRDLTNILKGLDITIVDPIFKMHQYVVEIIHDISPRYRTDRVNDNQDLRVKFLMNELTEEEFKSILQKREKKTNKYREIYDVLQMFIFTMTDIYNNLTVNLNDTVKTFENDTDSLRIFANTQLVKIEKRYNCSVPYL